MTISEYLKGEIIYDTNGQYIWVKDKNGGLRMIAEVRGWGALSNLFKGDDSKAAEFQDTVGKFIADAINEKLKRRDKL